MAFLIQKCYQNCTFKLSYYITHILPPTLINSTLFQIKSISILWGFTPIIWKWILFTSDAQCNVLFLTILAKLPPINAARVDLRCCIKCKIKKGKFFSASACFLEMEFNSIKALNGIIRFPLKSWMHKKTQGSNLEINWSKEFLVFIKVTTSFAHLGGYIDSCNWVLHLFVH